MFTPSYIEAHQTGRLADSIKESYKILENCRLCPRRCEVNRLEGEKGICRTGRSAMVSSFNPHFGEEDPLVGSNCSGTILMPGGEAGTRDIMRFIAKEVSTNTYVNIMDQYRPCGNADKYPPLDRCITQDEYEDAVRAAREEGIRRFDRQEKRMRIIRRTW